MLGFSVCHRDRASKARAGSIVLPRGPIETPVFMPVGTNGTVKAISPRSLEEIRVDLILCNTYHLYLRPGLNVIRNAGGLHKFIGWRRNILTDSGGFQVFSLARLRKLSSDGATFRSHIDGSQHLFTPESVVDAQLTFGSDIAMPLDVCTKSGITYAEAKSAVETTDEWLRRSVSHLMSGPTKMELFGIAQGNFYEDLRTESAMRMIDLDLPGYAIGGLSVGEPFTQFEDFLGHTSRLLPENKPRYLMGIGTPDYILTAIEHGIDMFDCVYPTRTARTGTVLTWSGPLNLKKATHANRYDPIEEGCTCSACRNHSRAYVRHLLKAEEIYGLMLTTEHNLVFLRSLVDQAKQAIQRQEFLAFKDRILTQYAIGA